MDKKNDFPLDWVTGKIGDFTGVAILINEAEPLDAPGPRIVCCNKAFTQMTGYSLYDVVGKTPRLLQGPDTDAKELAKLRPGLTS